MTQKELDKDDVIRDIKTVRDDLYKLYIDLTEGKPATLSTATRVYDIFNDLELIIGDDIEE